MTDNTPFEIRERLTWLKENPVEAEGVRRSFDLQGAEFRQWCPFCPCRSRRLGGETGVSSRSSFRRSLGRAGASVSSVIDKAEQKQAVLRNLYAFSLWV